jgi:uncharacterized membrane protein YeiH
MTFEAFSTFGIWTLGTLGVIDLIAATTNAFNGALIARRPDHYRHFTIAGVILLALAGGIGGGVLRDVILNDIPAPFVNPWYLIGSVLAAILAIVIDYKVGQKFRSGIFQFMSAFSLPWYAIVGAQKTMDHHLGYLAAIFVAVIGTTGGRFIIDIACLVVPKQLVRGEFFVLNPILTACVYILVHVAAGLDVIASTAIAVVFGFSFRLLAQFRGWEEWEPTEPAQTGVGEKARSVLGDDLAAEFKGAP